MSYIFISYSRKDLNFAEQIVDALAQNNLDTWIDWKSIPKGEEFYKEIYQGIERADAFIFLISPDSVQSKVCNDEIIHAVQNGKRILPIVIRDAEKEFIPNELSKRNWIFCRDGQDDFNSAIKQTRDTIYIDYEWLKFHTELQVKALRWDQGKDDSRLLRGKELREAEQKLATVGIQEDPQPTTLQREYILKSRRNEERQRKQIRIGLGVGMAIILSILIGWGWTTTENSKQLAYQVATAGIAKEIAIAQKLAAQSKVLGMDTGSHLIQSSLLAVESLSRLDNIEASEAIRERLAILPNQVVYLKYDQPILALAFNPKKDMLSIGTGNYGNSDEKSGRLILLDTTTYQEVFSSPEKDAVKYMEFSSDGSILLTASLDGSAQIWDISTHKIIAASFCDLSISGKGELKLNFDGSLVICHYQDHISVWESKTGKEVLRINLFAYFVDFSPDSKRVVFANGAGRVFVWALDQNKLVLEKNFFPKDIASVRFTKDDKSVIVSTMRGNLIVFEISSGKEIINDEIGGISTLILSNDASQLVSYNAYGKLITFLNTTNWEPVGKIRYVPTVSSLSSLTNKDNLITIDTNGLAQVWDVSKSTPIIKVPLEDDNLLSTIAVDHGEKYIATGSWNGILSIFSLTNAKEVMRVDYGRIDIGVADWMGAVESVDVSSDGKMSVSSSTGKSTLIDLETHKLLLSKQCETVNNVSSFSKNETLVLMCNTLIQLPNLTELHTFENSLKTVMSPLGNLVAYEKYIGNPQIRNIVIWDVTENKEIAELPVNMDGFEFTFSPNGKILIINGQGVIRLIDPLSGKQLDYLGKDNKVINFTFSPDNTLMAAAFDNGVIDIWMADTGFTVFEHKGILGDGTDAIEFSPDNKSILVTNVSGGLELWNVGDDRLPLMVLPSGDIIRSAIFNSTGDYIIAGSQTGVVRIFSTKSGKELARMYHNDTGLENHVDYLAISPDNQYVISGSYDGTVRVWLWRPVEMISALCSRLPRNLTIEEWKEYFANEPYHGTCPNLTIKPESAVTQTP